MIVPVGVPERHLRGVSAGDREPYPPKRLLELLGPRTPLACPGRRRRLRRERLRRRLRGCRSNGRRGVENDRGDERRKDDVLHVFHYTPHPPECVHRMPRESERCRAPPPRPHLDRMLAAIRSAALRGIDAYDVIVEVDAAPGLPQWTMVGLPQGAVKESRERVGAALVNAGFALPPRRVTVNLAPADIRKDGTAFDLPIALGVLVATDQLDPGVVADRMFVGELGLDGSVRGIRGALSVARRAACGNVRELVLPWQNVDEAGRVSALPISAPRDLRSLVEELREGTLSIASRSASRSVARHEEPDFAEVVGQETAKRALEVAAAGGHNLLMVGPPGGGKTMLARRLPGILPELTEDESLEVIAIHSVAGTLTSESLSSGIRPFRAPHHSISSAGLIGGGSAPRPGEVSLAHNGVLFLDEMLEFPRSVLDGLRQPMEDGRVVISRTSMSVPFPARFTLIGATNPCPCGRLGDPSAMCTCSAPDVDRYVRRVSGPLADRIDMHVAVGPVAIHDLSSHVS